MVYCGVAQNPPPIIGNELCLVIQRLSNANISHTAQITYAVENGGALSTQVVADRCQGQWDNYLTPLMSSDVTSEPAYVVQGDGTNVPSVAVASGAPSLGTRNITTPPPQVSSLTKKQTALGGKANRGRLYIPWLLSESEVTPEGGVDGTRAALIQSALNSWRTALATTQNIPMLIANKTLAISGITGKPYVTHVEPGPVVTRLLFELKVATQRRRLVRS